MTKYFDTELRFAFLVYFLTFRSAFHFCRHTGFSCSIRYLKRMKKQFLLLEKLHSEAKINLDFEKIANIETGNLKLY